MYAYVAKMFLFCFCFRCVHYMSVCFALRGKLENSLKVNWKDHRKLIFFYWNYSPYFYLPSFQLYSFKFFAPQPKQLFFLLRGCGCKSQTVICLWNFKFIQISILCVCIFRSIFFLFCYGQTLTFFVNMGRNLYIRKWTYWSLTTIIFIGTSIS